VILFCQQIEKLLELFESDSVNIEEVEDLLSSYKTDPKDWQKFAKFDKYKYTRCKGYKTFSRRNLPTA
jgi:Cysteine dioxygenase type I